MNRIFFILLILTLSGCDTSDRKRAEAEIATMKVAIQAYQLDNGSFLFHDNAKIVKVLSGDNIKRKIYFDFPSTMLDHDRQVIDPWGTPYSFSVRDGFIYIISFGSNHIMDSATLNDVVGKIALKTEQDAAANP